MADRLRVGIVGCGGIARAHVNAYRTIPEVDIVSVHDVAASAAEALARETDARIANSPQEMAAVDHLDAVSICTPPALHFQHCKPFLQARIPVLCEKPLEANVRAAGRLAELARRSRTVFMTAFCHRFHPAIIELKKLIESGSLGKPLLFRNMFGGYLPLKGNHRADPALSGGGVLIDNGSHSVDLFRFLVGEPAAVWAVAGNVMQKLPVEDIAMIVLERRGKVLGEITSSYSLKGCPNQLEWYGTQGVAVVSYWNPDEPDLKYKLEGQAEWTVVDCSAHPDRFAGEVGHFIDCVRSGQRKAAVTVEDGYRASVIIQAAYESVGKGKKIVLR
ncbi:MAG: Gfo/Idh/MocA family oxidoreductase [Anaerolineae bacterium]|nr:Gfo/Idh/MocA family oxidoreductase [Thermoflexales bacterium]MDW8407965.1 Gfo/Idh/MocA family oxidoreductase [Anaerolineae bacterium]